MTDTNTQKIDNSELSTKNTNNTMEALTDTICKLNAIEIAQLTETLAKKLGVDTNNLASSAGSSANSNEAKDDKPKVLHIVSCAAGIKSMDAVKAVKAMYNAIGQTEQANMQNSYAFYKSVKDDKQVKVLDMVPQEQQEEILKILQEAGFIVELK